MPCGGSPFHFISKVKAVVHTVSSVVTSAHHTIIKIEAVVYTTLVLFITSHDNISKLEAVVNTASSVVINASSVTKIRRFRSITKFYQSLC